MSALTAFAAAGAAQVRLMGDPATLATTAGDKSVNVVFFAPWTGTALSGVPAESLTPEAHIDGAQWRASGAAEHDRLTVRGTVYDITEVSTDDGDMVRLLLRKAVP